MTFEELVDQAIEMVRRRSQVSYRLLKRQFDLDDDGLEELVGSRIVYQEGQAWLGLYTRRNGEWVFLPQALRFENPPGVRDRKSTRLNSSHSQQSRMPSSA